MKPPEPGPNPQPPVAKRKLPLARANRDFLRGLYGKIGRAHV